MGVSMNQSTTSSFPLLFGEFTGRFVPSAPFQHCQDFRALIGRDGKRKNDLFQVLSVDGRIASDDPAEAQISLSNQFIGTDQVTILDREEDEALRTSLQFPSHRTVQKDSDDTLPQINSNLKLKLTN